MPVTKPGSTPRWKQGTPLMTRRGRVVVLASACLVSATLAFVQFDQRQTAQPSPAIVATQPALAAVPPEVPKAPVRPVVRKSAAAAPRPSSTRPAATASTTLPVPTKSDVTTIVAAPAPKEDNEARVLPSIVTISGCLERDDQRLRLKDTDGEYAPRSRNWKSGFLRRSASTIDVVAADRLHLPTYVGQRVSVTGTLVDREMQVRSVSIVAESCEEKSA